MREICRRVVFLGQDVPVRQPNVKIQFRLARVEVNPPHTVAAHDVGGVGISLRDGVQTVGAEDFSPSAGIRTVGGAGQAAQMAERAVRKRSARPYRLPGAARRPRARCARGADRGL